MKWWLKLLLMIAAGHAFAQHTTVQPSPASSPREFGCGRSDLALTERRQLALDFQAWMMNHSNRLAGARVEAATYTLPVVFHIISHDPAATTDAQLQQTLQLLNDAFAHTNSFNRGSGVNTDIQFCLAQTAPDGGKTNGIVRVTTAYENFDFDLEDRKLKALSQWDPERYVNIWVVNSIQSELTANYTGRKGWTRTPLGGYATFPFSSSAPTDGVVVAGLDPAVLAHECGHYLGLYHTFEGQNCLNNNCLTDGDQVCDTPPDASTGSSRSCTLPDNSCATDSLSSYSNGFFNRDVPDMISNFMDYGNDACHSDFTQGQADRMKFMIETYRKKLFLNNPTNNNNVCSSPCPENINAKYAVTDADNIIAGVTVTFDNQSTGTSMSEWLINGLPVATTNDLTYNFPAAGTYTVTLKAFNVASCFSSYSQNMRVGCGVDSRFYPDKRFIASKGPASKFLDSVTFTNRSKGASSYLWTIKNDFGLPDETFTSENLTHVFREPGNYAITLTAINGACSDLSEAFNLRVEDPTINGNAYLYNVHCVNDDSVALDFYLVNFGYDTINVGTPVSFYDQDPRKANPTPLLLMTYALADTVFGRDTGEYFSVVVPVDRPKPDQIYLVFNDIGSTTFPITFPPPNTKILSDQSVYPPSGYDEAYYTDNVVGETGFQFKAILQPDEIAVCAGSPTLLNPIIPNGPASTLLWDPDSVLSCKTCLTPTAIVTQNFSTQLYVESRYNCHDTTAVTLTVKSSTPVVSNPPEVCVGANPPALKDYVTGTLIMWYTGETGGTGTTLTPVIDTSKESTTNWWVTETLGGCESGRVKLTASVLDKAPPPIVAPTDTVCVGTTPPLLEDAVTGANILWYTDEFSGTGSSTTPVVSTDAAGTFEYWATQTITGCESSRTHVMFVVQRTAPLPIVPPGIDLCYGSTIPDLSALAFGKNLRWYSDPTTGSGTDTIPAINTNTPGTFRIWLTQSIDGCESERVMISYRIHEATAPPSALPLSDICIGGVAPVLSDAISGENLQWYQRETGGVGTSGTPTTPNDQLGVFEYWVTQTIAGCESERKRVSYSVKTTSPPPTVTEIPPVCILSTPIILADFVSGVNLLWFDDSVTGSGTSVTPSTTTSLAGTFNHWVNQTIDGCASERVNVRFIVQENAPQPVVLDVDDICLGETPPELKELVIGENILWYTDASSTSSTPVPPNAKSNAPGTFTHWITQTINGCESPRAQVNYTVLATPPPPDVVSSITLCAHEPSPQLSDFVSGSELTWYAAADKNSPPVNLPVVDTQVSGSAIYWVSQTIGKCTSDLSEINLSIIDISIEVTPELTINEGDPQTLDATVGVDPAGTAYELAWYDSAGLIAGSKDVVVAPIRTTQYTIRATAGLCHSEANVIVNVINLLFPATIFSPNGDGLNESWTVRNIEHYPEAMVTVYNRWGTPVFQCSHYDNSWIGSSNGTSLPLSTYYYVIDMSYYNQRPLTGSVTIIK